MGKDKVSLKQFFDETIAEYLHRLVKLVENSRSQKILFHVWILGIEYNWTTFQVKSDDTSEFIPRLSFWIGGLRDKFHSKSFTLHEALEEAHNTFDAFTFAYFDYGCPQDVISLLSEYAKKLDSYFSTKIFSAKVKKFESFKKVVPCIHQHQLFLEPYFNKDYIEKQLDVRKTLEQKEEHKISYYEDFFRKVFLRVLELHFEISPDYASNVKSNLISLKQDMIKLGYDDVWTDQIESKFNAIKEDEYTIPPKVPENHVAEQVNLPSSAEPPDQVSGFKQIPLSTIISSIVIVVVVIASIIILHQ